MLRKLRDIILCRSQGLQMRKRRHLLHYVAHVFCTICIIKNKYYKRALSLENYTFNRVFLGLETYTLYILTHADNTVGSINLSTSSCEILLMSVLYASKKLCIFGANGLLFSFLRYFVTEGRAFCTLRTTSTKIQTRMVLKHLRIDLIF